LKNIDQKTGIIKSVPIKYIGEDGKIIAEEVAGVT
jgi:hypothetical protein